MILNVHTTYPQTRAYVLKLHRDCDPADGNIAGRLEHLASGVSVQFNSAAELIARLTQLAAAAARSDS